MFTFLSLQDSNQSNKISSNFINMAKKFLDFKPLYAKLSIRSYSQINCKAGRAEMQQNRSLLSNIFTFINTIEDKR
jgi:hypothetical protein